MNTKYIMILCRALLCLALTFVITGCIVLEEKKIGGNVNTDLIDSGIVVLGNDYQAVGVIGFLTLSPADEALSVKRDLELTSPDAVVRAFPGSGDDRVFVINRLGYDYIQVLDPHQDFSATSEFSVELGSNPQDLLLLTPDRAFITRYEQSFGDILIINPFTGDFGGTIPLNQLATNQDGLARPTAMLRVGYYVFVLLQNLDRFFNWGDNIAEHGLIAVVDIRSDTLVDTLPATPEIDPIHLMTINPQTMVYNPLSGKILVASAGLFVDYHPEFGGIEVIDPEALASNGVIFTGNQQGIKGNITDMALYGSDRLFLSVSEEDFSGKVIQTNPETAEVEQIVYWTGSDGSVTDIIVDPDQGLLVIADQRTDEPRLLVYELETGEEREADKIKTLGFSPSPFSLALWEKAE